MAENVFLNRELFAFGRVGRWLRWMDKAAMRRQTAEGFARLGLTLPSPKTKVTALSGGQRQAVAIARAVLWGSHIVVLDEPAAALGVRQTEIVLTFIERLRAHGVACIFISHNMQHVMRVADRIVLLRLGEKIFDGPARQHHRHRAGGDDDRRRGRRRVTDREPTRHPRCRSIHDRLLPWEPGSTRTFPLPRRPPRRRDMAPVGHDHRRQRSDAQRWWSDWTDKRASSPAPGRGSERRSRDGWPGWARGRSLADLSEQRSRAVAERIGAEGGVALPAAADVRQYGDMERVRDACLERFGRIDFAVANAGIGDSTSLSEGDPERWRVVLETNVLGVAHTVRAVLPTMRGQGGGHLVLIASVSGREPYAGEPIYAASKWAVVGLGHALRKETVGSGIRVTLIEPGIVDTPLARGNIFAQTWLETITPLRDEDVANAVAFALLQPKHMAINELVLRSTGQEV